MNTQQTERTQQALNEIRDMNLSFLMLAQSLIREDRESAMFQLGVNIDTATMIAKMSNAQLRTIATTNQLLCSFRFSDDLVFSLITKHDQPNQRALPKGYDLVHASIVRASKLTEVL